MLNQTLSTPVGTLTYTAPELLNGDPYGKEVDYWALGVIMHIMLCGYSPWSHCTSEIQTRRAIVDEDVTLKDEDWIHVSEPVKDLILRLLHRNPKKRATNDEILTITWEENKNQTSWKNARSQLRKTLRGDRARQCSTGTVEANLHLMKRVYSSRKYSKKRPKDHDEVDSKEDRYLSPPPSLASPPRITKKPRKKKRSKLNTNRLSTSSLSQSCTAAATDEESANGCTLNLSPQHSPKRRKKSCHSSEPLSEQMVKYPNHEYRTRAPSRDDSELCNRRMKLAAKSIERYIERQNREKRNAQRDSDDEFDAFPGVKGMSFRLFDL